MNKKFSVSPYPTIKGDQGTELIKKLKRTVNKLLPSNVNTTAAFQAKKQSSRFPKKDKTKKDHQHNVVYKVLYPQEQSTHSYIGEAAGRLTERILDHSSRYKNTA